MPRPGGEGGHGWLGWENSDGPGEPEDRKPSSFSLSGNWEPGHVPPYSTPVYDSLAEVYLQPYLSQHGGRGLGRKRQPGASTPGNPATPSAEDKERGWCHLSISSVISEPPAGLRSLLYLS